MPVKKKKIVEHVRREKPAPKHVAEEASAVAETAQANVRGEQSEPLAAAAVDLKHLAVLKEIALRADKAVREGYPHDHDNRMRNLLATPGIKELIES